MKRGADHAEAADLRFSASGRNGHSQQVNTTTITTTSTTDVICGSTSYPVKGGGSKDLIQDQTDQNDTYISNYDETTGHDQRDDNYITKGDELKEVDHLGRENKRVPFWRKLIAYRPWKSKRSSSELERKGIFGGSSCDDCCSNCGDCCYCSFWSCFWRYCSFCSFLLRTHHRKRKQGDVILEEGHVDLEGCVVNDGCVDKLALNSYGILHPCSCDPDGIVVSNSLGYHARLCSLEPNPGIKRPTVTVVQTPPPPRP